MKVAVVHDWLPLIGGAERVLKGILEVYPNADVYTLFNFLTNEQLGSLGIKNPKVSYLNRLPKVDKYYRNLFPLCAQAIESFDLSDYDLIISSSHFVAKGVITRAEQTHISYMHSPPRYAWDLMHHYLKESNLRGLKGYVAQNLLHKFRIWDSRTANGVDYFIANSDFIRRRIWKVYRRESDVIYPPVNVNAFSFKSDKSDSYLAASRLVPYKKIDLIVSAFAKMPSLKLNVIGDGPEMNKIQKLAEGSPNIKVLGYQPNSVLVEHMQNARAFVFAAEEDFGIMPVEAQACGTPVIAYAAGGALETVKGFDSLSEKRTGEFFYEQKESSLISAVTKFEANSHVYNPIDCREHAKKFDTETFKKKLREKVDNCYEKETLGCVNKLKVV